MKTLRILALLLPMACLGADKRIDEFPAAGALVGTDLLLLEADPSGTPAYKKLTLTALLTYDASATQTLTGKTITFGSNTITGTSAQLATAMSDETGSGAAVFATSPTLVTPTLGAATATSINGLTITASTGTLTITNSKTLSVSNTLTFTGTDSSSVAFGAGGTVVYTTNHLGAMAATTSAQLAGVISDETGSGAVVLATSPTLVTPVLGAATGTSLAVTAGLTSSGPTGAGIGYATGAGGSVTQTTTRTTGVTLNKLSGQITTDTTSLAAEAAAEFTVTNSTVALGDVVAVSIQSGTNGGNTAVNVTTVANGSFNLKVSNNNASGGTAETGAIIINFAVIKAVAN